MPDHVSPSTTTVLLCYQPSEVIMQTATRTPRLRDFERNVLRKLAESMSSERLELMVLDPDVTDGGRRVLLSVLEDRAAGRRSA